MAAHVTRPMAAAVLKLLRQRWPMADASSCMVARWMGEGLRNVTAVAGRYVRRAWSGSARPFSARYVAAAVVRRCLRQRCNG
ncbi:hypothetical protein F511_44269 [Dorcoceras hygrometricum]|uniref:Uncharacterized protein n=1 Tax=Dorcoceras hygrometricum TaxID=472368 RepID=A0A2Z7CE15_9LAMI|nr:hypothetical protein F511_44269 [Dorcoceras hygrometricum]